MAAPYVINQPNYPDVNGLKPDFYALKMIVPGLYNGVFPVGLTAIDFEDGLESGKLRGNSPLLLAKSTGDYHCKASLEMWVKDYYNALLPFLGNINPLLGAYEVAFSLDLQYATANDPFPTATQIVSSRIGKVSEAHKQGQDPLKVKIELDEPYMIVRNGVVPFQPTQAFWPTPTL